MWKIELNRGSSKPQTISKKRKFSQLEPRNLHEMVEEDRNKIRQKQRNTMQKLEDEIARVEKDLRHIPEGFVHQKQKQSLRLKLQKLRAELDECRSDSAMKTFDMEINSFLQAYDEEREAHLMEQNAPPKKRRTQKNTSVLSYMQQDNSDPNKGMVSPGTSPSTLNGKIEAIMDEYVSTVRDKRPPPVQSTNDDICMDCEIPTMLVSNSATMVCPQCGMSSQYLDANFASVYCKDNEHAFHYKRINHLNDWLLLVQAKESQTVPQDVINKVMQKLADEKISESDVMNVSNAKIRDILKTMRLRKYYDNVPQIRFMITGIMPPQMTPYQEERCRLRFLVIQQPFKKHRPKDRKNFLSYPFVLYKICEIENWVEFLPCFRLPKGDDKRKQQDEIWEKICNEVDGQDPTMPWPFYPTPPPVHPRKIYSRNTYGISTNERVSKPIVFSGASSFGKK